MIIINISSLALSKIKPGMTISLGGGSNVFNLAKEIKNQNLQIKLISPSEITRFKCKEIGLEVAALDNTQSIDLAFDGVDGVDYDLNAMKSGGGIHFFEKIAAKMSKEYILLLPSERIQKDISSDLPLCIELAAPALNQFLGFCKSQNLRAEIRQSNSSFIRSPLGNLLIDVYANNWKDIAEINDNIIKQNGVVSSSYFTNLVTSLITTNKDNEAIEIKKGDLK